MQSLVRAGFRGRSLVGHGLQGVGLEAVRGLCRGLGEDTEQCDCHLGERAVPPLDFQGGTRLPSRGVGRGSRRGPAPAKGLPGGAAPTGGQAGAGGGLGRTGGGEGAGYLTRPSRPIALLSAASDLKGVLLRPLKPLGVLEAISVTVFSGPQITPVD